MRPGANDCSPSAKSTADRPPCRMDRGVTSLKMVELWRRLPVVLRAALTGLVMAALGTTPWAVLVAANYKYWPAVPWAVPPAVLYLWLFWRYVLGAGWPRSTSEMRRANLRVRRLAGEVWGAAILAGILGLWALVLLLAVMNRLVTLPQQPLPDLSHIPVVTLLCFLLTGSAVAGIVEEASFRGYMQQPIERRHGPVVAILVTGTLFAFGHLTHPEVTLILMPYYLAVSAVYGALAYLTNSILPSMVLHAGGNFLGGIDLLTRSRAEWQASASPSSLVWDTGTDAAFWISCVSVLIVSAATIWAYSRLASIAREK
jgi:membrane protease YdiL (CAAX protease family)